jgi:RNA polymerase sigma-70 factor (ECF subfamily)
VETLEALYDAETLSDSSESHWPAPVGRVPTRPNRRITSVPADASDETLLARFCRGNADAGERLVARHCGALHRYLQRIAGARAAEDLLQQTWLSALAHADRFVANPDTGSFKGWLFRIAANKTKDHWRSARRERAAKEGFGRMIDGNCSPWAGHAADGSEQGARMLEALAELPEAQREVLMLRYYSDMKFADIAEVLGCPLNTALTRAHKGLIKLRDRMAPQVAAPR